MFIRSLFLFLVLITTPSLAGATWNVNATTSPSSGAGTVSSPGTTSYPDTTLSADYMVTPAAGYKISAVRLNGAVLTPNGSGNYTVTKSAGTSYLVAYFAVNTFNVTISVSGPGSVSPAFGTPPITSLVYGNNYTFNITANTGYMVNDVKVDGVSEGAISSYTFLAINANHSLWASFSIAPKVVAAVIPLFTSQTTGFGLAYGALLDASNSTTTLGSLSYLWSVISTNPAGLTGGAFNDPTIAKPVFYGDKSGEYTVQVDVSDGLGHSSQASVVVTVQPRQIYLSADCIGCHRTATPPMSTRLDDYLSSVHSSTTVTPVFCNACHNPNSDLGHPYIYQPVGSCAPCHVTYTPQVLTESNLSPHATANVGCVNCHSGHAVALRVNETTFSYTSNGSSFCFTCHHKGNNLHYNTEAQLANICVACHVPAVHNPAATMSLPLGAQHFNGYTSLVNPNYRAAYVTQNTLCSNCHITTANMPNASDSSLLQQRLDWAVSGHGNTNGQPWLAYDFKTLSGCVQCHTTKGFIAYSSSRMTAAWGTTSKTRDVLACNACHTDINSGALRTSLPIQPYANDTYTNPNLGNISNLCLKCHSGMNSGRSIKAQAVAGANFTNLAFIGSHSSAAAGILFQSIGYEFTGRDYSNKWHFKHDQIGINNYTAYNYPTGGDGPCVGCHMSSPNKHTFSPLAKNAGGVVTAITSPSCVGCHTGPAYLDVGRMNAREVKFAASLLALQKVLEIKNIYYANVAPYFFKSAGNTAPGNAVTNWGNADTMGAAFNFNLLQHEPGAYAHNMIYAKRLICDSIDFLDNGAFDNSVSATINGLSSLNATQKATAIGYLIQTGTRP